MSELAFPLQWPDGWPRTSSWKQSRGYQFKETDRSTNRKGAPTFARSRDRLLTELRRMSAKHVVISTNHKPDRYGNPVEAKRKPADDGVAIYFEYGGKSMAMACDRYDNAAANMTSLALAIEAMRQLERHGGGTMMERAFSGFAALPPAREASRPWWEVLGIPRSSGSATIRDAHRRLLLKNHPDAGGSSDRMAEINAARDTALKEAAA